MYPMQKNKQFNHLIKSPFKCPHAPQHLKKNKELSKQTGVKTQTNWQTEAAQSRHLGMERHPTQPPIALEYTTTAVPLVLCRLNFGFKKTAWRSSCKTLPVAFLFHASKKSQW